MNDERPAFEHRPQQASDDEGDGDLAKRKHNGTQRKKGGYVSRIEQILYEDPDLVIVITDAGKSHESGGSYIVYTIRTGVIYVHARIRLSRI